MMSRSTVKGFENLRSVSAPVLLVANHVTMVDHALVLWSLPGKLRRRTSIAMDGELLRDWLKPPENSSWFTRTRLRVQYVLVALFFNIFSMPQHGSFRRSFEFAGEMIDCGYSVLVFPEGRRSPDGKLQVFKSGIGLLVKGLNVPVVPIRIDGLDEMKRQGKHFAPRGAIKVTIGESVTYSAADQAEAITKDLNRRLNEVQPTA
jgi:long-chain acyl-CoA synthetase